MTVQKLLSLLLLVISILGCIGALPLRLWMENNVGPGFFPMLFSILLAVSSLALFFKKDNGKKVEIKKLFKKPLLDGTFFYFMLLLGYFTAMYVGLLPALGVFSFAVLFQQKKLSRWRVVAFVVILLLFIGLLFSKLLKIPFERGLLFR